MIYIDEVQNRGRLGQSSKMISDNGPDELKNFVKGLGMNPAWIRVDSLVPHINVFPNNRVRAIEAGAKPITRQEYLQLLARISRPEELAKAV
ncbi:MAG TPA: DUF4031 domain-containing protein [Ignavibacteriales bacterium]|nr:DUF4031 domain-containing protein [Ignavibacteriales bacterium]